MIYREQNAQRALSPTSITIADYVINPYSGCDFNCVYCYGKMNNTYQKKKKRLGDDYVEYKPNFLDVLEKEVAEKKPTHVLIGSITEVYQHIEQKKEMTRRVLQLLNKSGVSYTILTKSPGIVRDTDLIAANDKNEVYMTVNTLDDTVRKNFEAHSSAIDERLRAMRELHNAGIRVIAHVGPFIPGLSDAEEIMRACTGFVDLVEFESLNLKMSEEPEVAKVLKLHYPKISAKIAEIYASKTTYDTYYTDKKESISQLSKKLNLPVKFFFYPFDSFYSNEQPY